MTKDDLTTTLHEQYNTFPSSIQDPEAFHHDVFEVAITASTADEFHALLASRKQQRLRELHESLESAAFEIIAHPKLVGTDQWQFALQLFRTRSLDSLVRYFSSYLDRRPNPGDRSPLSPASSFADYSSVATAASTVPSSVAGDDHDDHHHDNDDAYAHVPTSSFLSQSSGKRVFTCEPEDIRASLASHHIDTHLPPTPRSSMDEGSPSPVDAHTHTFRTNTHSFSHGEHCLDRITESIEAPEEVQTPASSEADLSDSRSSVDSYAFSGSESGRRNSRDFSDAEEDYEEEDYPTTQFPTDTFIDVDEMYPEVGASATLSTDSYDFLNSETPTPKPDGSFSHVFAPSKNDEAALFNIRSPARAERTTPTKAAAPRRNGSPTRCSRRTPEESACRIQKPAAKCARATRPMDRARLD